MRKCFLAFLGILLVIISSSCGILLDPTDFYQPPDSQRDESVIALQNQVNTMQDGYDFAKMRVDEWAKRSIFKRIIVVFAGDQIEKQRGIARYFFTADDGKTRCYGEASVMIDMETSVSTEFYTSFDTRTYSKRNRDGYFVRWELLQQVDISKWTLTLDEAFDIIYEALGDDAFSRFENHKIILNCYDELWNFEVVKESAYFSSAPSKHIISINPITKEIVSIVGFEDTEL